MTIANPRRISAGVKDGCPEALGFADETESIARIIWFHSSHGKKTLKRVKSRHG
jgi:hypothetical protein